MDPGGRAGIFVLRDFGFNLSFLASLALLSGYRFSDRDGPFALPQQHSLIVPWTFRSCCNMFSKAVRDLKVQYLCNLSLLYGVCIF